MTPHTPTLTRTDLQIRPFAWSDIPAIARLINVCQEYDQLEGRTTVEELENEWRSPLYTPEKETMVIYGPEGELIAYGWTEKTPTAGRAWGGAYIHPTHRRQGLGSYLLRTTDANFLDWVGPELDAETPIYVLRWIPETKAETRALLEREGYQQVRTFYTMRIELNQPLEPVAMPEGFTLKPFDPETQLYTVYEAQQEAFRDHWGHTDDVPFEDWKMRLTDPNTEPGLWYIAWDGDQVAGVSLCAKWGEDIPQMAWVNSLGVRRPWRKRGLASALLRHSFYEFQQRGYTIAGLGVDAANPTGAVALYERNGMYVWKRGMTFRKVLRGNPELIRD